MNSHFPRFFRRLSCLLAFPAGSLYAADNYWVGGTSTDWNTGSNWSLGTVPGGADNAHVDVNGLAPGTFRATISADVAQTVDILVSRGGANANSPGVLNHTAGKASTGNDNWLDVGTDGGNGIYNLANTNATGGSLTGFGLGSGSVSARRAYIGGVDFGNGGGTGVMNMNTTGTATIANDLSVGVKGAKGTLNLDAGTITTGGWNFVGRELGVAGSDGTLNMSGGTISNLNANDAGAGRFYIGLDNALGKLNMSGGTINNTQNFFAVGVNNLANAAVSTLAMTGGTINAGRFIIGGEDGGAAGKGKGTVAGGLIDSNNELWVGNNVGSSGELVVSAGTVRSASWMAVGRGGSTGVLTINGTGLVEKGNDGSFEMSNNPAGNATVNLDGGTLRVNQIVTGGGTSTFNFNGGTLKPTGNNGTFLQGLTSAFVKTAGARINTDGFNVTVNQPLVASVSSTGGGLTKEGAGILTLGGVNTYTGATTVTTGGLVVLGSVAGSVNVASGASLGGNGSILGAVNIAAGGTLAPGASAGTLLTGALTLGGTSVLDYELTTPGVAGGATNDLLSVTGNLTLDGTLKVTALPGFAAGNYRIINYTGALTNNTLVLDSTFLSAYPGSSISTATAGQVNLTVVPEPAATALLAGGLGLMMGRRRRNDRKSGQ